MTDKVYKRFAGQSVNNAGYHNYNWDLFHAGNELRDVAYPSLSAAIKAIGTDEKTLYITTRHRITSSIIIPSNISIVVLQGGSFDRSAGTVLTISGPYSGFLGRHFYGTGTTSFGSASTNEICCEWFGASPSNPDNTDAFNEALVSGSDNVAWRPGRVTFGSGLFYHSGTIVIPQRNIIFEGVAEASSHPQYNGSTFQNGMEIATGGEGYVIVRKMELQCSGKGKYAIHATAINEKSEICVSVRGYTGVVDIESGFYCDVDIRAQSTAWDAVTQLGITQANWLTVYGPGRAPIMLGSMNSCKKISIQTYRVGSVISGGVTPYAIIYMYSSAGFRLNSTNLEWGFGTDGNPGDVAYDSFESAGVTYSLRSTSAMLFSYCVGDVSGVNVETMRFNNLIKQIGECNLNISSVVEYQNYAVGDRFVNEAGHDVILDGYKSTDTRGAGALFKTTDSGISARQGWIVRNANMAYGKRYTQSIANGGPNNDPENVLDTFEFASTEKMGCPDDTGRLYNADRLYTPKILTGYVVTNGTMTNSAGSRYSTLNAASIGDYINITPGVMMLETGTFVDSKRATGNGTVTGLQVNYRLRPITASKYYRVFVNRAGSPYLVEYASAQTDPLGNWIAEFATDASIAITGLVANARLALNGFYIPNTSNVILRSNGRPGAATGYYLQGDMWIATSPTSSSVIGEVVTVAGTSPTWLSMDDFTAKSLACINLTASGQIKSTSSGSGSSSGFMASAASPTYTWVATGAGSDEKNWDAQASATSLDFRTRTDANGSGETWLSAQRTGTDVTAAVLACDLSLGTVGNGLRIKQGTNATAGVATLVGGTVVVNTTKVTANTGIKLTIQSLGTVAVPKAVGVTARTPGTSFAITSADATDTSVIYWEFTEPA